jgi:antirestriction protein ArdC
MGSLRAVRGRGDRQTAGVVGPPGSGKTLGLILPGLLCWAGSAVATSTKTDVVLMAGAAREALGRQRGGGVHLLDWSGLVGPDLRLAAVCWDPLDGCRDRGAQPAAGPDGVRTVTASRPRFRSPAEHVSASAYEVVTDRVLALLDRGTVPWRRPWSTSVDTPRNLQGRHYQGINIWLLGGQGYGSPYWLTWKQIHEHDGRVLKGERSTPVVFWKQIEVADEDGEPRRVPIARLYNVWNLEQCQHIEAPGETEAQQRTPVEPLAAAERIVDGMPDPPTIRVAGMRAFYQPSADLVQVPFASRFKSEEEWYAILFHELGHATGHEKRLHRPDVMRRKELGPIDLSREELVAEFTSSYLCAEVGIETATIENSAAYIENWSRVLKDDRRALVVAAGAAQRAADCILGRPPARVVGGRAVGRERERGEQVDAGRERDGREAVEGVELHGSRHRCTGDRTSLTDAAGALDELRADERQRENLTALERMAADLRSEERAQRTAASMDGRA